MQHTTTPEPTSQAPNPTQPETPAPAPALSPEMERLATYVEKYLGDYQRAEEIRRTGVDPHVRRVPVYPSKWRMVEPEFESDGVTEKDLNF